MQASAELLLDARAVLGEGAIWSASRQVLYWVDILGETVHVFDPLTGRDQSWPVGQSVGTVVPRVRGGVLLAVRDGFAEMDDQTGRVRLLVRPAEHRDGLRFNDGKCDPAGRFWAGTMALSGGGPVGRLYRFDPDWQVTPVLDGITCSNGIAWTPDQRTMLYIDTPTMRVDAFDYDAATGTIARRRPVIAIPEGMGFPDGSTIDAAGMLWIAHWDGARVTRWNPRTGEQIGQVTVPAPRVTSCAFGGPRLDQLYITTARTGLDAQQLRQAPLSGGLFVATPGVGGLPASEFAG